LAATWWGAGTSAGLTSPLARMAYQNARISSHGAAINAARDSLEEVALMLGEESACAGIGLIVL
jgi:hypothetical protein